MEQLLIIFPEDVAIKIVSNVQDLLWKDVQRELRGKFFFMDCNLDRGYTIRNYMEEWAVIPRFIHNNRVYGSYLRNGRLIHNPL